MQDEIKKYKKIRRQKNIAIFLLGLIVGIFITIVFTFSSLFHKNFVIEYMDESGEWNSVFLKEDVE